MLPTVIGRPIRVEVRRSLGPHLAASHMNRRVVLLDSEVLRVHGDFERILVHEIFHFAWRRLSPALRRSWEALLRVELASKTPGELGWSAEFRKAKLKPSDLAQRSPLWRRYAVESFCDTAAWRFSGLRAHDEFTLAARDRRPRKAWFDRTFPASCEIPI